jgi:hypothetical protein
MAQATDKSITSSNNLQTAVTRRFALFQIGKTATVAAVAAVPVKAQAAKNEQGVPFKHPSEYLAAMNAIGAYPVALFSYRKDSGVHSMGVAEGLTEEIISHRWCDYHAISMRCPFQPAADMPAGHWWDRCWQYLYDRGLRENVTLRHSENQNQLN